VYCVYDHGPIPKGKLTLRGEKKQFSELYSSSIHNAF